ncbi:MAG: ATP-binding protein [Spirochaetia bacterium]|jgi:predicted AAA+ superfamily ATPase|nr:ATP-binding protein [Spirochaetia bacterium]
MIARPEYIARLLDFKDKQLIKVITGVRRCGKSTLLEMFRDHLRARRVAESRITYLNFEDMDNQDLTEAPALHKYVGKRLVKGKMNYVFFDEIQMVREFPRVVDSLFIKKNVDLYITGSNQYFLSDELATLLTGRYVTINMMPLSFKEYVSYYDDSVSTERRYEDYLRYSSFPFAVELNRDLSRVKDYLGGIYNTIVMKDVAARRKIIDLSALDRVTRFIFDNIGNLTSIKRISDTMASSGRKVSVPAIESYFLSLQDAFMVYRAKRWDVKGKRQLLINDKYYVVDIALRSFLLGEKSLELSHALENVIYLELVRRGYEVYVGKVGDLEVDFIALKYGVPEYYQVSATVREKAALERELAPLYRIKDNYPKFLLTLDRDPPAYHEGIRSANALDFLLGTAP